MYIDDVVTGQTKTPKPLPTKKWLLFGTVILALRSLGSVSDGWLWKSWLGWWKESYTPTKSLQ